MISWRSAAGKTGECANRALAILGLVIGGVVPAQKLFRGLRQRGEDNRAVEFTAETPVLRKNAETSPPRTQSKTGLIPPLRRQCG
jgi:hypothetical protein